ncbi:MAG TPA: hypothetical protein VK071_09365 [Tissierellales bacterium]|nr:hypothetical protein [Tissierellales bacterium]
MASKEQLRKVAIYCDEYNSNTSKIETESCENCTHFTENRLCDIDLVDEVLSNLAMELDLKR